MVDVQRGQIDVGDAADAGRHGERGGNGAQVADGLGYVDAVVGGGAGNRCGGGGDGGSVGARRCVGGGGRRPPEAVGATVDLQRIRGAAGVGRYLVHHNHIVSP